MANEKLSINERLDQIIITNKIPGLQYTVVDDTGVVFEYSAGVQNIANKTKVTAKTAFMLNSSTKIFTAAAILQLSDKGKINIDHSLSDFYSDHPYGETVTIRHLLNQTSGISNPLPLNWLHLEKKHQNFDENVTLAKVLADNPALSFSPGEKYAYSNIAYWLLGKVIEKVSGINYCEYLRQFIFIPLAIGENELSCTMPDDNQRAIGYQKKYSFFSLFLFLANTSKFFGNTEQGYLAFKPLYHNGPSYGGLFGNGRGIAKFLTDMLSKNPIIFSKETHKEFFTVQQNNSHELIPMTLGWRCGTIDGNVYYEKPGGGPGSHSNIRIYPIKNIATIYMINKMEVQEKTINSFSTQLDELYFMNN